MSESKVIKTYISKVGSKYELLDEPSRGKRFLIRFIRTGSLRWLFLGNIKSGEVKDLMEPSVYSTGYIGDGVHSSSNGEGGHNPVYSCWKRMIKRCYDPNYRCWRSYGGRGVKVDEKWHNFQNFAQWSIGRYSKGMELDKDLLCSSGLLYSESTCCFIPPNLNSALSYTNTSNNVTNYKGVSYNKRNNNYSFCVSTGCGNITGVGFDSALDAHLQYKYHKEKYIHDLLNSLYAEGIIEEVVYFKGLEWRVTNEFLEIK